MPRMVLIWQSIVYPDQSDDDVARWHKRRCVARSATLSLDFWRSARGEC